MHQPSITLLLCRQGQVLRRVQFSQAVIRIGRHPGNHLQLDDAAVIKRHALIELLEDRVVLSDLTEGGGMRLNGRALDEARLTEGDRIQLGATELVVEQIQLPAAALASPSHAVTRREPEAALAWSAPAQTHGYALLRSGPAVRSEEVELAHVISAEVTILWGENVLHVAHLRAGQSFHVGDEDAPRSRGALAPARRAPVQPACDFSLPREKLGMPRMPLVLARGAGFALVIAAHAEGQVRGADGSVQSWAELRPGAAPFSALPGARLLPLTLGTQAELRFGDIVLRVAAVRAGKPLGHGLASGLDTSALPYFALSALSVGGLLSSLAFLVPPLGLLDETESEDDRLYRLQAYLEAAAEREREREPRPAAAASGASADTGGERAAGEEGALGAPAVPPAARRTALAGDVPPPARQLSRSELLEEVERTSMVGLLRSAERGLSAPDLGWISPRTQGGDELSALGDLWSEQLGEAAGSGLSLTGTGLRGGGRADNSIGAGGLGIFGRGGAGGSGSGGNGDREGTALSAGRTSGVHRTGVPRLREASAQISGRLPPDTIRRVVRQNHARLRLCYEKGLMTNPTLTGRVNVRFVIGNAGRVTHVTEAGSDLPDAGVVRCVTRAFHDIGFPKPESGIVTVIYPIAFQPE